MCINLLCLSAALLCYTGFQNQSLIRSTSSYCSTCCFGLGFQLQNLQDIIKISRAESKDIFLGAHCAVFGAFWRLFGPFLGHIVGLEGTKGPLVTRKSSRRWSVAALCLRLAVLNPYSGCFGRKMAVFGPKLRRFGRAPPDVAPPPRAATGEFWAQNLDLARAPPRLQDGYIGTRSEALGRSNCQNGTETCCCLLVVVVVS